MRQLTDCYIKGHFVKGPKQETPAPNPNLEDTTSDGEPIVASAVPRQIYPLWDVGTVYDLRIYLSDDKKFTNLMEEPVVTETGITLGESYKLSKYLEFPTTEVSILFSYQNGKFFL